MPPRPRSSPEPSRPGTGSAPDANGVEPVYDGSQPAIPRDDPRLALTHALEDLHVAAKAMHLPPMRVEWQQEPGPEDLAADPEQTARQVHVSTLLADYEGLRSGPPSWALPDITEPTRSDEWLVEGLIRPGMTIMLAGPPGAAKSWVSRQLALCCGADGERLFLDRYAIARPLNVLVVDEDNGPDEEYRREETLLRFLDLERAAMKRVRRVSLAGILLDQEPWQRWLRGQIRLHEVDLVILDPISELHGGKELREDPDFRSLLGFLKRLRVDFPDTATVLVHHTRKPGTDRGSAKEKSLEDVRGQWGQTPDVIAIVSPLGERRTAWEVHKRAPHSRLTLEQIAEGEKGEGALRFVADEKTTRDKAATTDGRVLGAIDTGATTADEIVLGTGLSRGGVYKTLTRLKAAGLISKRPPFERIRDSDDPIEED